MAEQGLSAGWHKGTHYIRAGAGEVLLLIHGVGMNCGFWAPQINAFSPEWDVIAYDTLGHGGSPLPSDPATLAEYAAQAIDLLDGLGVGRVKVVGHSMGALIALDLALRHPDRIGAVVAMNAVYRRSPEQRAAVERRVRLLDDDHPADWQQSAMDRWFGARISPQCMPAAVWVRAALGCLRPEGYRRAYRLFATADAAHTGRLGRLRLPALFLTGELDGNSSPAMARQMAVEAPDARALILSGERHMMSLASPVTVNAALRDFLEEDATLPLVAG